MRSVTRFISLFTLCTAVVADDRPYPTCLQGIKAVSLTIDFERDDESAAVYDLSRLKIERELTDLLTTAGLVVNPRQKNVVVNARIESAKFRYVTKDGIIIDTGHFGFEVELSVQQTVIIVRPLPVLPLPPPPSRAFLAMDHSWREARSGLASPAEIKDKLHEALHATVDVLAGDWKRANPSVNSDRVFTNRLPPDAIREAVQEHDDETKYGAMGEFTHCSAFIRDVVQDLLHQTRPELQGQVKEQFDQLATSPSWTRLNLAQDKASVFAAAQILANSGAIVVVVWKNPSPTPTDTGHIALVVPGSLEESTTWGMKVPVIAQAGKKNPREMEAEADKSVFSSLKLSWGFGPDKAAGMEVFEYIGP